MCFWPFSKKKKKKMKGCEESPLELEAMVEMDSLVGALYQQRMNRKLNADDSSSWTAEEELEYQPEELQRAIEMLGEDEQAKEARIHEEDKKNSEEEDIEKKVYPKKTFIVELVVESRDMDEEKEQD